MIASLRISLSALWSDVSTSLNASWWPAIGALASLVALVPAFLALSPPSHDLRSTSEAIAISRSEAGHRIGPGGTDADERVSSMAPLRVRRIAWDFKITDPVPNEIVRTDAIMISGVGAVPGAVIQVSVFTDQSYPQDGEAHIATDGKWWYGPVYFRGHGDHDRHQISARLIVNGVLVAETMVRGARRASSNAAQDTSVAPPAHNFQPGVPGR
jgi:hypothetical protein